MSWKNTPKINNKHTSIPTNIPKCMTKSTTNIAQRCTERKLKFRLVVVDEVYIAIIYFHLPVVLCLTSLLFTLLFNAYPSVCSMYNWWVLLVVLSICCQKLLGEIFNTWPIMCRCVLRTWHLQAFIFFYHHLWSPFIKHVIPQIFSLTNIWSRLKVRASLILWHLVGY